MKYTTERPTVPGYYWVKTPYLEGVADVFETMEKGTFRVARHGDDRCVLLTDYPQGIQWAGPIEIERPEE